MYVYFSVCVCLFFCVWLSTWQEYLKIKINTAVLCSWLAFHSMCDMRLPVGWHCLSAAQKLCGPLLTIICRLCVWQQMSNWLMSKLISLLPPCLYPGKQIKTQIQPWLRVSNPEKKNERWWWWWWWWKCWIDGKEVKFLPQSRELDWCGICNHCLGSLSPLHYPAFLYIVSGSRTDGNNSQRWKIIKELKKSVCFRNLECVNAEGAYVCLLCIYSDTELNGTWPSSSKILNNNNLGRSLTIKRHVFRWDCSSVIFRHLPQLSCFSEYAVY